MKHSLALLVLGVVLGCNGPEEPKNVGEPKALDPNAIEKNTDPAKPKTELGDGPPEVAGGRPVTQPEREKGFNEKRLFQLSHLETVAIEVNGKKIKCWLMDEADKRNEGMMHLTKADAPLDHGMLFVFATDAPRSFWMRNTLIDLDLAYIHSKGKAVSVHLMKRLDETGVPSEGDAMYVLEMPAGGFKPFGIKKGSQFKIPASVKSKDSE